MEVEIVDDPGYKISNDLGLHKSRADSISETGTNRGADNSQM